MHIAIAHGLNIFNFASHKTSSSLDKSSASKLTFPVLLSAYKNKNGINPTLKDLYRS